MLKKEIQALLPKRKLDSQKGDFGHIFVLAGSLGFTGAAILCAQGATYSGAGLVTLGIPKSLNNIVAKRIVEIMTKPLEETKKQTLALKAYQKIKKFISKIDIIALGPGLSRNSITQKLIRKIVSNIHKPMVIDADGLNALAGYLDLLRTTSDERGATKIFTPHLGEMSRLSGMSIEKIKKDRINIAKSFARKYNITLVLKGYKTIVASPEGKIYINHTGNPGMSKGGTGDVLTGMIASFLGQGLTAFNAAKLGVYLHGLAGDLAAKQKSQYAMSASDILEKIPLAFKKVL
ncbi:MAG: NAD(P)H-hydrate dehydratase [Candidatus Omnitrophota bacterium]